MSPLLSLVSPTLKYIGVELLNPVPIVIPRGITVVIGPNGAGKTTLANIIARGRNLAMNKILVEDNPFSVQIIRFDDVHSLGNGKVTYRQQRYESSMNDEVPSVSELLGSLVEHPDWDKISSVFGLKNILDKRINYLSSGETRKLLIIKSLVSSKPDLLILDNPYLGLDMEARSRLDEMLVRLPDSGISVMLLLSDTSEIPDFAQFLIPMKELTLLPSYPVSSEQLPELRSRLASLFDYKIDLSLFPDISDENNSLEHDNTLVELRECTVAYGSRLILDKIDWIIRKGEKWILSGPNGSGKSTLLSLIYADNPLAYSNDVRLFGHRRGNGETIWEVKKRIGYISPEMHLYFGGGAESVTEIIARGLNDTVGSYTRLTDRHYEIANRWINFFRLEHIADRRFNTLSDGEQRLVLLARTLVKNPPLLLLDEPMQGLDEAVKRAVRAVIDSVSRRDNAAIVYVTHFSSEVPDDFNRTLTLQK